jgi:hypothetical protein
VGTAAYRLEIAHNTLQSTAVAFKVATEHGEKALHALHKQRGKVVTTLGRMNARSLNPHEEAERSQAKHYLKEQLHDINGAISAVRSAIGITDDKLGKMMHGPMPWELDYTRRQADEIDNIYTRWTKGPHGYAYDEASFDTQMVEPQMEPQMEIKDYLQPARRPPCTNPSKSIEGWENRGKVLCSEASSSTSAAASAVTKADGSAQSRDVRLSSPRAAAAAGWGIGQQ